MIEAGFAKVDVTSFEHGMVMMGWGRLEQRIAGVAAPLHARALVLRTTEQKLAFVVTDVLFVSAAVRRAVLARLAAAGFGPHQVLLAATHTHAGPSGFSHYWGHTASSFGFSRHVFDTLVDGMTRAVLEAEAQLTPAVLRVGSASIPFDEPVAFNRSVRAYMENPDVAPVDPRRPAEATDRESITLRVDSTAGVPLGAVNWFGVHCSSLHADNSLLHPDNKGVAAARVEAAFRSDNPAFVALFAQNAAGDVSPNFRDDAARGVLVGTEEEDLASAERNGAIQARYAIRAWERALASEPLQERVGCVVEHVDLARAHTPRGSTTPPILGLGVAAGTGEGPGPLRVMGPALRALCRLTGRRRDPKIPWLAADKGAHGRFLGLIPMRLGLRLVAQIEPRIAYVKAADDAGLVGDAPWFPRVHALQLVWIGGLLLCAIPFEATTVAGRRLRRLLAPWAERVVPTCYANGYGGYLATPEEYRLQHYEGAATYHGEHTLSALENALGWLARSGGASPGMGVFGPELPGADLRVLEAQRAIGEVFREPRGAHAGVAP